MQTNEPIVDSALPPLPPRIGREEPTYSNLNSSTIQHEVSADRLERSYGWQELLHPLLDQLQWRGVSKCCSLRCQWNLLTDKISARL